MDKEIDYMKQIDIKHIKSFGQYFTQYDVANFMCSWACSNAKNVLDPAVGNSVFFNEIKRINPKCILKGYELDSRILDYFGNPTSAEIINDNYLLNDWDKKYDSIVCNPPYNRFQSVPNRNEIIDTIYKHTGIKYSGYTNLYILFLMKSIFQLSSKGKLAYIIPTEFLNSKYGVKIKDILIKEKLLKAIINFKNNDEMFFNATTTCCILLIDKSEKKEVLFYNLSSINELSSLKIGLTNPNLLVVNYSELKATEKWRPYINQENKHSYKNLCDVSKYCTIKRGIATGSNEFFCMSKSKIKNNSIPNNALTECICHSTDVKVPIFTYEDFKNLANNDKTVYLLDVREEIDDNLLKYILKGEACEINKKYLLSCRTPWYSMEQKEPAPIWVTSACRNSLKFIRNLAEVKNLTTFHSIYIKKEYADMVNIIFCYLLTPVAQTIIRENRKELGNGLEKFQPNDLKEAKMLDLSKIKLNDLEKITDICHQFIKNNDDKLINELNTIFSTYLIK